MIAISYRCVKIGGHACGIRHIPAVHEPEPGWYRRGERHTVFYEG